MKTSKQCEHRATLTHVVLGLSGPYTIVYCTKCLCIVSRTPTSTPDHVQALRDLAAQDGIDAGPAKPCTHNEEYVFGEKGSGIMEWCARCHMHAVLKLMMETPLERLPK